MCWKTKRVWKVSDGAVRPSLDPCVRLCVEVWLMAVHLYHRSSVKGCPHTNWAWAGSTEPAVNAGWSELCRCWMWPGERQHRWKCYWRGGCHRKHKSSSVRSVAWKSNGNTMICFNHAHKTTEIRFCFKHIKHSFATYYLFKMNGITLKLGRS